MSASGSREFNEFGRGRGRGRGRVPLVPRARGRSRFMIRERASAYEFFTSEEESDPDEGEIAPPPRKKLDSSIDAEVVPEKGIEFVVQLKRLDGKKLSSHSCPEHLGILHAFGILVEPAKLTGGLNVSPTIQDIFKDTPASEDGRLVADVDQIISFDSIPLWKIHSSVKFAGVDIPRVLTLRARRRFSTFRSPAQPLGEKLLDDTSFSDFVFVVGGNEIPVHKAIVSARSPVMRAMLMIDMEEKRSNRAEISDVDASVFEALIRYIYTGRLISEDQEEGRSPFPDYVYFLELARLGDFYQVKGLEEMCERGIEVLLTVENAIDMLVAMEKGKILNQRIREKIIRFITMWSEEIMEAASWAKLEKYPHLFKDFCVSLVEMKNLTERTLNNL